MNHSKIFKAAHRQAKRMECLGCDAYNVRFAEALKMMYGFARKPAPVALPDKPKFMWLRGM